MKHLYRKWILPLALAVMALAGAGAAHAGIAERAVQTRVAGIDVIVYPMDVKDVVTMVGVMPLGDAHAASLKDNPAVPALTGLLLDAGTTRHDKFQISEILSGIGAEAELNVGRTSVSLYGKSLTRDLGTVVGLLAEQLREPAFKPEELAKAKVQLQSSLRDSLENPAARASSALSQLLFPPANPNAQVPAEALLKAIDGVTLDQVKAFHAKYFGPAHMTLVFAGDVDPDMVRSLVEKAFGGWSGGVAFLREAPAALPRNAAEKIIDMRDKASVNVLIGQATGLRYTDPDYLPLSVAVNVLGSGFTGRLMGTIRAKEGLTYGIRAMLAHSTLVPGEFLIGTSFAPQLLDKGVASTRRELEAWWKDGITAGELADRKRSIVGRYQIQLGNTYGMASSILQAVEAGVGVKWLDAYPQKLQALTLEQVNGAIRKHLDPATMVTVEAGTLPDKS